jgi:hypothetical protein
MRKLLLASVAFIAAPTFAAGKPLAVQVTSTKAVEGAVSAVTISTTGGNGKAVKVTWVAQSGSAIAGQDFPAFYSAEAMVDNKHPVIIHVPTIEDAKVEDDETFTVKATVTSGTVHPVAAGIVTILDNDVAVPPPVVMQTCPDGSVIPATQGCPVVVVTPPSDPVTIVSPTLSGLPDIASNFDRSAQLVPTVIPQSGVPDTLGAFRFICTPGQVLNDDPIVWPGQPGKSHLHQFYGNTAANANSTYESLRATGDSTCMTPLNRSAYWMPAMLDGKGNAVRPDYVQIYYKRFPKGSSDCARSAPKGCLALPNGLRFIFGRDMLNLSGPVTGDFHFLCDNNTGTWKTLTEALKVCSAGHHVGAVIEAPGCWDGVHLDVANHRDHVSYTADTHMGYLACPATHPYMIPQFTLGAFWTIVAGEDTSVWHFSSDEMAPNEPAGSTFHADWFGAWDSPTLKVWTDFCIDKLLNCSAGLLGDGTALKQTAPFSWTANPRLVPIPQ